MSIENWQEIKESQINELKELLADVQISEAEYQELVEDLLDIEAISQDLKLEDNKIKAQKAIDALKVIAGLL
jgi:hypothetical protein